MEKITMNEGNGAIDSLFSAKTNYGACSLVVLIASGLSWWFGFQLAFAQIASTFSSALTRGAPASSGTFGGNTYGFTGAALIIVAFLTLVWAIALAGAGFAVKRGRVFSLLTILIVMAPLFYLLLEFFTALQATGPALILK